MKASAGKVPLVSVEASYCERPAQGLPKVIDGQDTARIGWSVFPRTDEGHSLIVRTAQPVRAQIFDLTLCFLSGMPKRYFGEFALSYTTDSRPSLTGVWRPLTPTRFSATGTEITLAKNGHLIAGVGDNMIADAIFQIRGEAPLQAITGFRVDVFPFQRPDAPGLRVAWNQYRDFCLTEIRVEAIQTTTTNVALGAKVQSSHPLWADLSPGVLTDGLPGSFNHPADPALGSAFFFDIDLGTIRNIDHVGLRGRADGYGMDRLSKVRVRLFDQSPDLGSQPVWEIIHRADGSHPTAGEIDILRPPPNAAGRFLRISCASSVAHSPQIAEVEAYETLTPGIASIKVDGHAISTDGKIRVPAGTGVLSVRFSLDDLNAPDGLPIRWRLRGLHDDWQITRDRSAEISDPPPGSYPLEARVVHTDGEWDRSALSVPVVVLAHFWQTPAFYWSAAGFGLLAILFGLWMIHRRREARRIATLEYQSALALERTRIARDMHDEVGARLSQLALMQDLIIRQHPMPAEAQSRLRELAVNTRQTVDALDHVVWAVNPVHDTLAGVAEYLSYAASSYLSPLNVNCHLDMPFEWPDVEVRAQVRHQLILAFREALQNIAKHSHATNVTLTMRYDAPHLFIRLTDDGRGLPDDPAGTGKEGLSNMKIRMEAIGGVCDIQNVPIGTGTKVELRAPIGILPNQT